MNYTEHKVFILWDLCLHSFELFSAYDWKIINNKFPNSYFDSIINMPMPPLGMWIQNKWFSKVVILNYFRQIGPEMLCLLVFLFLFSIVLNQSEQLHRNSLLAHLALISDSINNWWCDFEDEGYLKNKCKVILRQMLPPGSGNYLLTFMRPVGSMESNSGIALERWYNYLLFRFSWLNMRAALFFPGCNYFKNFIFSRHFWV